MNRRRLVVLLCGLFLSLVAGGILTATEELVVRIMPLGDSITQASADTDSYRRPLWKLLQGSVVKVDFVGTMSRRHPDAPSPHSDFDLDHEGHWGWRADQVLAQIDGWINIPPPDIVLLHLGTNDILQRQDNKDTVEEIRKIVLILRKHNPKVEVFLALIIPIAGKKYDAQVRELNSLLSDMVRSMTTDQSPVHLVNQYDGFDAYQDTYDGTHPNDSGIKKMAQRWHEALAGRMEQWKQR